MTFRSYGKCLSWDFVENRARNRPRCNAICPYDGHYTCSRHRDHGGCHHSHGMEDCYWVWDKFKYTHEGELK